MRYDTLRKLLNTVRRHLWLQDLVDRTWLGLILTSGTLGLAAILHTLHINMSMSWWGPMALLPVAVTTIIVAFNRPSLAVSARAADRWLNSHDLLTTAWHLRSQTARSESTAAPVVLVQADQLAADPPRSLPQLRSPRHPLPTAIAVAVAATSLFFLSLQGTAPSNRSPAPMHSVPQAQTHPAEDYWLSALETGLSATSPAVENTQSTQEPSSSSFVSSNEASLQASPDPEKSESVDPDPGIRSDAPQITKGTGAGQGASQEEPRPAPDRETSNGTVAFADLEFVTLQRKPADEAMAIDHAVSVELTSVQSDPGQPGAMAQDIPAARAAREHFSPSVGPAYKALQTRYFEETSHVN
jgi:hypothetical protein